jgi:predicted DNA-binding protein (UPF0251 family)
LHLSVVEQHIRAVGALRVLHAPPKALCFQPSRVPGRHAAVIETEPAALTDASRAIDTCSSTQAQDVVGCSKKSLHDNIRQGVFVCVCV